MNDDNTTERHQKVPPHRAPERAKKIQEDLVEEDLPEPLPDEDRPGYPDPNNPDDPVDETKKPPQ